MTYCHVNHLYRYISNWCELQKPDIKNHSTFPYVLPECPMSLVVSVIHIIM